MGVYYDHFDTDRAFSLQTTIDPSGLVIHPSGFVASISFSIVDEQGQTLLPEAMKFMVNYNSGRIIISDIEDKILTPSSGSFNLKLTHQSGVFEACVNATSEDSQCISDTKQIPTGAYLKVDFNLQHEAHTCSIIGQFEFQNVKMRLDNSIVTF